MLLEYISAEHSLHTVSVSGVQKLSSRVPVSTGTHAHVVSTETLMHLSPINRLRIHMSSYQVYICCSNSHCAGIRQLCPCSCPLCTAANTPADGKKKHSMNQRLTYRQNRNQELTPVNLTNLRKRAANSSFLFTGIFLHTKASNLSYSMRWTSSRQLVGIVAQLGNVQCDYQQTC